MTGRRFYGISYGADSREGGGTVIALRDLEIKNLKPPEKPKKLYDGGGLFLYLASSGLWSWKHEYACRGRRSTLIFGTCPDVTLKEAQEKPVEAKRILREGNDPGSSVRETGQPEDAAASETFRAVATEWFDRKKPGKKESYAGRILGRLDKDLILSERQAHS